MKKINFYTLLIPAGISIFMLSASTNYSSYTNPNLVDTVKQEIWLAPSAADSLKNPLKASAENIAKGEELYNMYCFSCHGDTGYGDGPAGGSMGVRPANFHDQRVIKQKDGALFWKLTNGKGNMPPFKEILTEEQRWQMILWLREFGKQQ